MGLRIPIHNNVGVEFTWRIQALGISLGLLLLCGAAFGQLNLGRIFGGITDQSGGAIVGAQVTVIDAERGISRPLVSDSAGEYSAPSLIPGMYRVRAEAKGFKTIEKTDVVVGVGQDIRIDLSLQPGEQTQTVTVTGEAPSIDTTNAQLGGTLENQTINQIPINGRQYTNLLGYKPGVVQRPGTGSQSFISNGNLNNANVWMFDGLLSLNMFSETTPVVGGNIGAGGPNQGTILPIDSIQEINVIENPKSEYGWKPGAQVNVGLKSGTNEIHGTALAFGRDDSFDAKNPFLPPTIAKAAEQLEQFGGSIGGPIKKDKLFYFGAYEGQRYTVGNPRTIQEPTGTAGAGTANSFPDAIRDILTNHPTIHLNQLSLNLAGCTATGACNEANSVFPNLTNSATMPQALNTGGGSDNALAKIDYRLNDHNLLNGEFFFGDGALLYAGTAAVQSYWREDIRASARVARGVWIWTPNSTWVNEARFGLDYLSAPVFTAECTQQVGQPNYTSQFGFVSGAALSCGFPLLTITGFTGLGATATNQWYEFYTYSGMDNVSFTRGKHLLKFGGETHITTFTGYSDSSPYSPKGVLTFGSVAAFPASGALPAATPLEDFLAGVPGTASVAFGNPQRTLLLRLYSGFAQDDWRILPRLTVNLGLRYEDEEPVTEQNNQIGNFDPSSATGLVQATSGNRELYKPDRNNFGPRVGFAWDVTGKGTTVVRGGASVLYNSYAFIDLFTNGASLNIVPTGFKLLAANGTAVSSPGNINTGTVTLSGNANSSLSQIPWAVSTPVFNGGGTLACGNGLGVNGAGTAPANAAPCSIKPVDPNFKIPYVTTWTLGVQHAFNNSLSLDIAYVGNHGTKFYLSHDVNQPAAGAKTTGNAVGSEQSRRPYYSQFPYLSQILQYANMADASYEGLQTSLTERMSHGLTFVASYSFAHALDQTDSGGLPMNSLQPNLEHGNSLYDARHSLTLLATYLIPGRKAPGQMLEGWQLNSAVTVLSPFTYNALDSSSDLSGTGELNDRWSMVGSTAPFNSYGGPAPIPCYGISTSATFTAKNGCTVDQAGPATNLVVNMPPACQTAAAAETTGPGGTTGTQSLATLGCYMAGNSVIVPPAQGTFGTMGRDVLRMRDFRQWDLSITKDWKLKERVTAQFRVESFNVLNQLNYAAPSGNPSAPASFGQSQSTPNATNPLIGSGGPRQIQLGLKLIF